MATKGALETWEGDGGYYARVTVRREYLPVLAFSRQSKQEAIRRAREATAWQAARA